jgi:hypothetical protein
MARPLAMRGPVTVPTQDLQVLRVLLLLAQMDIGAMVHLKWPSHVTLLALVPCPVQCLEPYLPPMCGAQVDGIGERPQDGPLWSP